MLRLITVSLTLSLILSLTLSLVPTGPGNAQEPSSYKKIANGWRRTDMGWENMASWNWPSRAPRETLATHPGSSSSPPFLSPASSAPPTSPTPLTRLVDWIARRNPLMLAIAMGCVAVVTLGDRSKHESKATRCASEV